MRVPWIGAVLLAGGLTAHADSWLPQGGDQGEVVQHTAYTLSYNSDHHVANWVAHALRPEHLKDCVGRESSFKIDPDLRGHSVNPDDYARTGFDRGHLAPAGDMKWSKQAMQESFYMSNISPQTPLMNRGRWAQLENLVRAWAKNAQETLIVTGPVLEGSLPQMGPAQVSVPSYHFKALFLTRQGQRQGIAFLMPQAPQNKDLRTYVVTIRKLEEMTGLNFYSHLSQDEQDRVEKDVKWQLWDFAANFTYDSCSP